MLTTTTTTTLQDQQRRIRRRARGSCRRFATSRILWLQVGGGDGAATTAGLVVSMRSRSRIVVRSIHWTIVAVLLGVVLMVIMMPGAAAAAAAAASDAAGSSSSVLHSFVRTPDAQHHHPSARTRTKSRRRHESFQQSLSSYSSSSSCSSSSSILALRLEELRGGAGGRAAAGGSTAVVPATSKKSKPTATSRTTSTKKQTKKSKNEDTIRKAAKNDEDSSTTTTTTATTSGDGGTAPTRARRRTNKGSRRRRRPPTKQSHAATATTTNTTTKKKELVSQALHETDAAQALGDAIRQRGPQLRRDDDGLSATSTSSTIYSSSPAGRSIQSVGWALGASDYYRSGTTSSTSSSNPQDPADNDATGDGGVGLAPASVVAFYFLQSHGGAHALQCACSALASLAGLGACWLSSSSSSKVSLQQLTLLRRCLWLAMIKHVSGLLAAVVLAARGIAEQQQQQQRQSRSNGVRRSMQWMQQLASDPVAQYTFYAATLLVWLPSNSNGKSTLATTTTAAWWQVYRIVPFLLVGPVLLRELVSTALVVSDVLVLWAFSNSASDTTTTSSSSTTTVIIQRLLLAARAVIDAVMSLLVTPTLWRSAQAAERQAILAKLTSKVSLAMEVAVGALLTVDVALGLAALIFGTSAASTDTGAPTGTTLGQLLKRLICTHLYLQFLWTRRRRIHRLATAVRGGASQLPLYVLSVALDPCAALGLTTTTTSAATTATTTKQPASAANTTEMNKQKQSQGEERTWRDYVRLALEDDDKVAAM